MKGKAIREPSQTYTHTHTHGCTHVYTHAQLIHINIVAQVIWVLCCFCFSLCLFALSSHSISCSSSSICFLFFSQPLCLIFSQHTPTQLHTYLPSPVLLVSVNYNEKNSYSISKRSVIIKKKKKRWILYHAAEPSQRCHRPSKDAIPSNTLHLLGCVQCNDTSQKNSALL